MSVASSGGVLDTQFRMELRIARNGLAMASRISPEVSVTTSGVLIDTRRPRTCISVSSPMSSAEPIVTLILSAVCSPTAMSYVPRR